MAEATLKDASCLVSSLAHCDGRSSSSSGCQQLSRDMKRVSRYDIVQNKKLKKDNETKSVLESKPILTAQDVSIMVSQDEATLRKLIHDEIICLTQERGSEKSICPSEVARKLFPNGWRSVMQLVRDVGSDLALEGRILILQKGQAINPENVRGPIRFRYVQFLKILLMASSSYVGRRIVSAGYYGTVRYVGPIPPTEGEWLGIDWDNPNRGKHDGTHEGVKYFTASYPTSGSFLRPQKAEFGITYSDAVIQKYGFQKDDSANDQGDTYIGSNSVIKPIEFIGFDKIGQIQSQFHQLREICLHSMKIFGTDDDNVNELTPNVVELDLSESLLTSWFDVARIIKKFKHLKILHLNDNRLVISTDNDLKASFKTVSAIYLTRVQYDWNQVLTCAEMWPHISELVIAYNNIGIITQPKEPLFENLEKLDMDSNRIEGWQQILNLGHLPKLQYLNVNNCGIESIFFPNALPGHKTSSFPQLQILGLNDNKCDKWIHIAELNKLKKLKELRMRNNPICDTETPALLRQLFIAKIGGLKMLNRVQVTSDERRGAEIDYLKKYGLLWIQINGQKLVDAGSILPSEFLTEHPRYLELVKQYGAAEESEYKITKQTLKNKLVSLKICSPLLPNMDPIIKKLPLTMSVLKLKSMLPKLLKLDAQSINLSYKPEKVIDREVEIPLDNDLQELNFFSIENNDTILVRW
uniref:Tubulin-specific chaperone E n=1 Tax=Strigamia maritima TaxID=126957 RepID=T1J621_STRMM